MRPIELLRLMPLVLLAAIVCIMHPARQAQEAIASAAPDLDLFPVAEARKALILTQSGCPPCARMKRDLAGKTFEGFAIEWGNAGEAKWKVEGAPTTIKFVAGKEAGRKVGYLSPGDLEAWMKK